MDPIFRDLTWRMLHNILPVMSYLYRLKISNSDSCPHCGRVETISHAFFYCPEVKDLWFKLIIIYDMLGLPTEDSPLSNNRKISINMVVFNQFSFPKRLSSGAQIGLFLIYLLRHVIWLNRNIKLHEKKMVNSNIIFQCFLRHIRQRIRIDFFRFKRPKFKSLWGLNPAICNISGENLHLNFHL